MVGGEEDESSEGDGMIYFFLCPLFCAEGKGRELWYKIGMWVEGTMYIVQTLLISLVLFFFESLPTISFFYLPGIQQQQHNYTQVKRFQVTSRQVSCFSPTDKNQK